MNTYEIEKLSGIRIENQEVFGFLKSLPDESVNCVVTSPPYFGLRDYGAEGQIGLEETPADYISTLVNVFREVRRVLRDDGTVWLNLGDSYAGSGKGRNKDGSHQEGGKQGTSRGTVEGELHKTLVPDGLKPKDLIGIPFRVAFALQADGWYLRSDIIWGKPNCFPESVTDRPTKAHEYVFLLTKCEKYYYDAEAIMEKSSGVGGGGWSQKVANAQPNHGAIHSDRPIDKGVRNKRTVWTINTQAYKGAHFAVMPEKLVEPCILAGCPETVCAACGAPHKRIVNRLSASSSNPRHYQGVPEFQSNRNGRKQEPKKLGAVGTPVIHDYGFVPTCDCNAGTRKGVVLDPFMGSGTVAVVALRLGRAALGCDINPKYVALAKQRLLDSLYSKKPSKAEAESEDEQIVEQTTFF